MSTTPEPGEGVPFTYEELADLQAGVLAEAEETDLRMRIQQNPQTAQRMMTALDMVDRLFPDPPGVETPLEVPPEVAARWQLAIANEAHRRARAAGPQATGGEGEPASPEASTADGLAHKCDEARGDLDD